MSDIDIDMRPNEAVSAATIVALWERLLRLSPIHPDDDFFDLGGDSLLALTLFHEIEQATGRTLPITAIYDASTPARLADCLARSGPARFSPLVLLKPGDGQAPLFIVHGIGGNVMELRQLGQRLDTARPVYAIQAKGLDGAAAPLDRIDDMADYDLAPVRALQPHGPYFLAGHSLGGLIAMEMARRLQTEGEAVALVAFFDSYAHPRTFPTTARWLIRFHIARDAFRTMKTRDAIALIAHRIKGRGGDAALAPANFRAAATTPALRRVYDATFAALLRYRPRFYPGKIVFFKPATSLFPIDPRRVWRRLAGEFELHTLPGDHDSIVRDDVGALAAALSRSLREAAQEP